MPRQLFSLQPPRKGRDPVHRADAYAPDTGVLGRSDVEVRHQKLCGAL